MDRDELIRHIDAHFPERLIGPVTRLLVPFLGLVPATGADTPGMSRFGGLPEVPLGWSWPYRPQSDAAELAARGGSSHSDHILEHLSEPLPLSFVAQIDLAQVHRTGDIAASLPHEGRLLFFYDLAIGPWDDSPQSARVIWDVSPAADLGQPMPPTRLRDLDILARRDYAESLAQLGIEPDREHNPGYFAPAQPVRFDEQWSLPQSHLAEARPGSEFEGVDIYDFWPPDDAAPAHHLLGVPDPEQNDPRYQPAFDRYLAGRPETDELRRHFFHNDAEWVLDWQLLLQVNVAQWLQTNAEGTVYFLIHRDDLQAHRFERAWAVYQQT